MVQIFTDFPQKVNKKAKIAKKNWVILPVGILQISEPSQNV